MVRYEVNGRVGDGPLNELFGEAWPNYTWTDFTPLIESSLVHVLAYGEDALVGFVRVAACGLDRGFVFGPTVRPEFQRQGVGTALLNQAASAAQDRGVKTLHVEFASQLRGFYARAGFRHTAAGIRRLT